MAYILTRFDTSTNKDLFKTLLEDTFNSTSRDAVLEARSFYNFKQSGDLYERTMRYAGMPRPALMGVGEGSELPIWSPVVGTTKDYNIGQVGAGFRFSWLFKMTNKYNLTKEFAANLKMNQQEIREAILAQLWNNVTSTSTGYTGYDTLALASSAHTCLYNTSDTFSNLGSSGTNVALSITGLEGAAYYFNTLKDDQGNRFFVKPETMFFCPTLQFTAAEIMKSEGKPLELSNTINIWKGLYDMVNYHYLTSTTEWGLIAKGHRLYDVNCFVLAEPDIVTADAPDNTRDSVVTSLQAFSWGFGDPRMVYIGST